MCLFLMVPLMFSTRGGHHIIMSTACAAEEASVGRVAHLAEGKRSMTCERVASAISSVDLGIHLSPGVSTHCSSEPSPAL
jgi:hypothetical protein